MKTKKPKTCQWREGAVNGSLISIWFTCPEKPVFQVQQHGVTLCHVCAKHSWDFTQRGYQVR